MEDETEEFAAHVRCYIKSVCSHASIKVINNAPSVSAGCLLHTNPCLNSSFCSGIRQSGKVLHSLCSAR